MNDIIRNLTIQNYLNLKSQFDNSKRIFWDEKKNKLFHPGEYGSYREQIVTQWLRMYTPERFGISSGFIINSKGTISPQCDIIIYDKFSTPKIENSDNQRFFPVESVIAVCEVKSSIKSINELNSHLIKLSQIKKIRLGVIEPIADKRALLTDIIPNPILVSYDNIFTILICNNLEFKFDPKYIDYKNASPYLKHNLMLSLDDGCLLYETLRNGIKTLYNIPFIYDKVLENHFIKPDDDELPMHIKQFLNHYCHGISLTTTLSIDMTHYFLNDKEICP
jgi:hypothetical protein